MRKIYIVVTLSLFMLTGCPVPPDVPDGPTQDAGAQDVEVDVVEDAAPRPVCTTPANCACASLCDLVCSECRPECEPSIEKILEDRIMPFDTDCVYRATTKEAVRLCPSITCR